jgi:hypothetical protein
LSLGKRSKRVEGGVLEVRNVEVLRPVEILPLLLDFVVVEVVVVGLLLAAIVRAILIGGVELCLVGHFIKLNFLQRLCLIVVA